MIAHCLRVMKNASKRETKKPANLYLSDEARGMAEALKKALNRPSISNVVETLIREKAEKTLRAA